MHNITLSFLNENTATSWLISDSDYVSIERKKQVISPSFKEGLQCLMRVIFPLSQKLIASQDACHSSVICRVERSEETRELSIPAWGPAVEPATGRRWCTAADFTVSARCLSLPVSVKVRAAQAGGLTTPAETSRFGGGLHSHGSRIQLSLCTCM